MVDDAALVGDILAVMSSELGGGAIGVDGEHQGDQRTREGLTADEMVARTLSRGVKALQHLQQRHKDSEHRKSALETARVALTTVLEIARNTVRTLPFQRVAAGTLRAYTDASIGLGVLQLLQTEDSDDCGDDSRRSVLGRIREIDMAIIVAGAVGPRRGEWAQALIAALQRRIEPPPSDLPDEKRNSKRARISPPPAVLHSAPSPIPAIPPPSSATYHSLSSRPFILRAYLSNGEHHPPWPALTRWRSTAHLLSATGPGRVVPVEVGGAYDAEGWGQRILPWETFMRTVGWEMGDITDGVRDDNDEIGLRDGDGEEDKDERDGPFYLAQHSLFMQFPALERDIAVPDYVWSEPPAPDDMPGYRAPPEPLVNVWIGPGGEVVSPAHTDPYFNCYAQVLGRKRVWVAPPAAGPYMYAYGGGVAENGAERQDHDDGGQDMGGKNGSDHTDPQSGEDTLAVEYMTNTSTVPVLRGNPFDLPSLRTRFPDFVERVYPTAMEAVLDAGDLLVMPPGWWHAMRGEGEGVCWSVSFWY